MNFNEQRINELSALLASYLEFEGVVEDHLKKVKTQRLITLQAIEYIQEKEDTIKQEEEIEIKAQLENDTPKRGRPKGSKNKVKKVQLYRQYNPKGNDNRRAGQEYKWNQYIGMWLFWADKDNIGWRQSACRSFHTDGHCGLVGDPRKSCAYYHDESEKIDREDFTYDLSKIEWTEFENDEEYYEHHSKMRNMCHKKPRWWVEDKALLCKLCQE
jgi:hypothetical protein